MTTSSAAGNAEKCSDLVVGNVKNYGPPDCSYRLWGSGDPVEGRPNAILVHGAVVMWDWHVKDAPNNNRWCGFHQLGPLLRSTCGYNVWEFEYADVCVKWRGKEWCVNYGSLDTYSERLIDAIKTVRIKNPTGAVYIIAHSMGGLVARCAAQKMPKGTVDKIVTLDTGHFGFEIAALVPLVSPAMAPPDMLPLIQAKSIPNDLPRQTKPGSQFLYKLAENFTHGQPKLLSLAAGRPIPRARLDVLIRPDVKAPDVKAWGIPPAWGIQVVSWTSSSLVQVTGDGGTIPNPVNTPFFILDNRNHMNIVEITDPTHPAFAHIINFLENDKAAQSQPRGDPYFTVVLRRKPQSGYPILGSMQNTQLKYSYDSIDDGAYHAVVLKVFNVQANQDIQIEYAPGKQRERGKLTEGQSTLRLDVIQN